MWPSWIRPKPAKEGWEKLALKAGESLPLVNKDSHVGHEWPRYCPGLPALEFGGSGRMETELGIQSQLCTLRGEKEQTAWRSWVASTFLSLFRTEKRTISGP